MSVFSDYDGDLDGFCALLLEYKTIHDKLALDAPTLTFTREFLDKLNDHLTEKLRLRGDDGRLLADSPSVINMQAPRVFGIWICVQPNERAA